MEVTFKSGGKEQRLLVGRKTPAATDLYAKLGDSPRVFLIPGFVDTTFNKTTFDLRDKTVLKVNRDSVDTLVITSPKRTLQFAKADGEWKLTDPDQGPRGLHHRRRARQPAQHAADQVHRGAPKRPHSPSTASTSRQRPFSSGRDRRRRRSSSARAAEEGVVYAKDQSRPARRHHRVDPPRRRQQGDRRRIRQTDLFDGRAFNATRLEVTRNGQAAVFEKTKTKNKDGQDEEKWKQIRASRT